MLFRSLTYLNGGAAKTADYGYDNTDQLKTATYSNGFQTNESYGYDANGNRNTNSFTVGTNNRLTSDGTFNYTYDNEGNRLTKTRISSATVDDYKTEYTWDCRNRLVGVVLKNNSNAKKKELLYDYDHLNRLVRRKADNDGNGAVDQTDVYVHDGYQIVLQFSAASSANLAATNLAKRHLWGVNPDELLADETVSGGVLWAATDHLDSVRDLLRLSGSTTSVANHLTYNAFGVLVSKSSATATDNTMFAYTGKWTDPVSGLQWNINRWYDALTGKWVSEDPIGFGGGDVNLYRYVGNLAISDTDRSGLKRIVFAFEGFGGVIPTIDHLKRNYQSIVESLKDAKGQFECEWRYDTQLSVVVGKNILPLWTGIYREINRAATKVIREDADGCKYYNTIIILGYSYGGATAHTIANKLKEFKIVPWEKEARSIKVDLVFTIDPVKKFHKTYPENEGDYEFKKPSNVTTWINFYQRSDKGSFLGMKWVWGDIVSDADNTKIEDAVFEKENRIKEAHIRMAYLESIKKKFEESLKEVPVERTSYEP